MFYVSTFPTNAYRTHFLLNIPPFPYHDSSLFLHYPGGTSGNGNAKKYYKKKINKFNGGRVPATRLQQSHNHPSIVVMVQNWKSLRALRLAAPITTTNQRPQRTVSKTSHTHPDTAYRHAAVLHAAPLGSTPISQPGNDIAAAQCRQITSPLPAYARSEWPDVLAPKIYVPTWRSEKHLS